MSNSPTPPATTTMGDPVVPILDIPPDENLGLSEETVAAVTAVAPDLQEETPIADSTTGLVEGDAKVELEQAPMEVDEAVATITKTTTITTTTVVDGSDSSVEHSGVAGNQGKGAGAGDKSVTVETIAVVEKTHIPVEIESVPINAPVAPVELGQTNAQDAPLADIVGGGEEPEPVDIVIRKETLTTTTLLTDPVADAKAGADVISSSVAADVEDDEPSILETMPVLGKTKREEEEVARVVIDGSVGLEDVASPPLKKVKEDSDSEVVKAVVEEVVMVDAVAGPEEDVKKEVQEELKEEAQEDLKQEVEKGEDAVQLGPKTFNSGVEMFQYFYNLLHCWVTNVDVNKYEQMVLLDLINKGHRDAETKIGPGIKSFQVRFHPGWHSRCFYLTRTDGSVDDFSYRKCVDKIMPLPENLYSSSGDLILEKVLGEDDKWGKKIKGKGFPREGGDGYGGKNRGGGGRWRGGGRGRGRWSR